LLEICYEAPRKPWSCDSSHVNEEVHVAFRRVVTSRYRAEKEDIARTMLSGDAQDDFQIRVQNEQRRPALRYPEI
jgi:hypothetical protein